MRTKNFGIEDPKYVLSSEEVTDQTLPVLASNHTGMVFDIKKVIMQ